MYGVVELTYYFLNHKPILLNERFVDPRPLLMTYGRPSTNSIIG